MITTVVLTAWVWLLCKAGTSLSLSPSPGADVPNWGDIGDVLSPGFKKAGNQDSRAVTLNPWVTTLGGGASNNPFIGVTYQISGISDLYIVIHNSSKVTVTE